MKLRVRVGARSGRLELPDGEVTLRELRGRLRQTFLPSLGFSPDADFSITLNSRDVLTEDESSLESLGIVSGDLIIVVTADIPDPVQESPSTATQTGSTDSKGQEHEGKAMPDIAETLRGRGMRLRVRVGTETGCLELQDGEPTLRDLRRRLRQTFLPPLGLSPDADFSITLNGRDVLTGDENSLESLGIGCGDLIVVVTADIPDPVQESPSPSTATQTGGTDCKGWEHKGEAMPDIAELSPASCQGAATVEEEAPCCPLGPILCSESTDGQIPHSLEALYLFSNCTSANDALVVVTHLLMVETGYIEKGAQNKATSMPEGWNCKNGVYKLHYSHPLCGDSSAALLCVPMGRLLIINATLIIGHEVKRVKKLQLPTESYITFPQPDSDAAFVYRDLQKLSRLFKDQLVYPLLAATRQALDLPDIFGLVVLPPELKLRIFRLLDVPSILSLGATCKALQADTKDPSLWRFLYTRDFRDHSVRSHHTVWKELYKQKYKPKCRCGGNRSYRPYVPRFPPIYPDPFFPDHHPPGFPFPPGIIGGEYDQRPAFPFVRDPASLLNPHRPRDLGLFRPPRPRIDPLLPGLFHNPSGSPF